MTSRREMNARLKHNEKAAAVGCGAPANVTDGRMLNKCVGGYPDDVHWYHFRQ